MPSSAHDKCGVIGLCSSKPVAESLYFGLRVLQHRGQESAGIATHTELEDIQYHRGMGLVHQVFTKKELKTLKGNSGIGHVRYSTTGRSRPENSQPMLLTTALGDIALAHNGDIANAKELKEKYQKKGWGFITDTDSEVIIRMLANSVSKTGSMEEAIKKTMPKLKGAYSLTVLNGGKVYAVRDPLGIRPLCVGKLKTGLVVASESVVIDMLEGELIRDVRPGEVLEICQNELKTIYRIEKKHTAHCQFEWVYFSRSDSYLDKATVYNVRRRIGRELAKLWPVDADVVVPVPDSGRTYALGYSEGSGIHYAEGLMKNRYVERTFILPEQGQRDSVVSIKLNAVRSVIEGKKVVLVDDSIVRGTTMKRLVKIVRKAGAKEVHVRSGCPQVVAPCYFGIDMKSKDQFIALDKSEEDIAKIIGADSVGYCSIDALVKAIGHDKKDLCLGCLTGKYPIKIEGKEKRNI